MTKRTASEWALRVAIALTISGAVMLLGSRERPWGDAHVMYDVGHSLVGSGRMDVHMEWPPMSHRGSDGRVYSQYPLAPSLIHVPGILLRRQLQRASPDSAPLVFAVTSHLAQALLAGLACILFFGCCRRLGVRARIATLSTLTLAGATLFFVYARSPYSEILQAAIVMAFVAELIGADGPVDRAAAVRLGVYGGLLINTKLVFAPSVAIGFLYVAWVARAELRLLLKTGALIALGFLPLVAAALWYNYFRWGSPFDTGYGDTLSLMRENPFFGLWGLLFSPGKSFLLFSPPCVLALAGWPSLARRLGTAKAIAVIGILLWPLVFYSKFLSWSGDYAWGPRYLVYLVAPLMLGFAVWLSEAKTRRRLVLAGGVVGIGVFVQVIGASLYWDHYIRISMRARAEWLGTPNRAGAAIEEKGRGHCDSCFEDMHGHQWLPPFSPINGHLWLLSNIARDRSYQEAQSTAPWRRYTSLDLQQPKSVYDAARIDWWGYLFLKDAPQSRTLGIVFLLLFLTMTLGGAMLWKAAIRKRWSTAAPEDGARQPGQPIASTVREEEAP